MLNDTCWTLETTCAFETPAPNSRTEATRIENNFENFVISFSPFSRSSNVPMSRVTSGTEETFSSGLHAKLSKWLLDGRH